jgi:DNA repair protein RadC
MNNQLDLIPTRYYVAESTAIHSPVAKIEVRGAASLSDAELLSLFLQAPDHKTVDQARNILSTTNLRGVVEQAIRRDGRGLIPFEQSLIAAAMELATRVIASDLERGDSLSDPQAAGRYIQAKIRHHTNEVFCALFLDTRHRVIAFEELFTGTTDGCEVHPRVVAQRALQLNAVAVIIGHNHPSGNPEPSAADRAVTARLKQSLALIDIRLLDHFVIADGAPVSLAARGWV